MQLLTQDLRARLIANGQTQGDHAPVVKFFSPVGAATWLFSELDEDGDTLFGLCDLGFGCPEMGIFFRIIYIVIIHCYTKQNVISTNCDNI